MVGGGIGVTPYASILNDLVFGTSTNRYSGVSCKKVRINENTTYFENTSIINIYFYSILRYTFCGYVLPTNISNGS